MKQLLGLLFLVGLVGLYFWWIVAGFTVAGVVWLLNREYRAYQAASAREVARREAVSARADLQHQWVCAGDPRGTYGTMGGLV